MKIPEGYKQTEVGVIPDDWDVKKFDNLTKLITCGIAATPKYVREEIGKPFLSAQNVRNGKVVYDNYRFINHELFNQITKYSKPQKGDLLYTRVGAGIGEAGVIEDDFEFGIYVSLTLIRTEKNQLHNYFLLHLLNSPIYKSIAKNGQFAGGGVQNLNVQIVKEFSIPLPPLPEQKAIAQSLSDVDTLIAALDQLITKKRNTKQGTMQQLLTGKKRLPGFSGEWEVKKLGEVLKVRHGKSQHDVVDQNGEFPILATGGEIGRAKTYLYDKPSVLIGRKGTIDIPQYMDSPFWTIDTLFYTEILTNAFPKFIFYRFNLINWYSYNEASGVPSLNAKTIENIEIKLSSVEEQKAIAQILSDMDAEIAGLEQKREKYKAIKQGMMQELLTGKTRLISSS